MMTWLDFLYISLASHYTCNRLCGSYILPPGVYIMLVFIYRTVICLLLKGSLLQQSLNHVLMLRTSFEQERTYSCREVKWVLESVGHLDNNDNAKKCVILLLQSLYVACMDRELHLYVVVAIWFNCKRIWLKLHNSSIVVLSPARMHYSPAVPFANATL